MPDVFDSPWKDILEGYFPEWLLVHIEVQGKRETLFARRMFVYAYRLFDRYARDIVSLAILADTKPGWRPNRFEVGRWGSRLGLEFPSIKLLDYADREPALEADANPFATVVLTHLAAQATRNDAAGRYARKLALTRRLYERGLSKQQVIDLYRFIDWVLRLPHKLELQYTDAVFQIEESKKMPYMSFVERRGQAQGVGLLLRGQLEQRFDPLSEQLSQRLEKADAEQLLAWGKRVLDAQDIDEVFAEDA